MQLEKVIELCREIDPEFIARTALYARERGFMKDMPALLCAVLSVKDRALLGRVFPSVIDNGKMLRNFVQIMRSGAVGRKSLGTAPKRLVREWLEARSDEQVFTASVGQTPSIADIVRMVHSQKADGRKQKAERQKAEGGGRKQKAAGRKRVIVWICLLPTAYCLLFGISDGFRAKTPRTATNAKNLLRLGESLRSLRETHRQNPN